MLDFGQPLMSYPNNGNTDNADWRPVHQAVSVFINQSVDNLTCRIVEIIEPKRMANQYHLFECETRLTENHTINYCDLNKYIISMRNQRFSLVLPIPLKHVSGV